MSRSEVVSVPRLNYTTFPKDTLIGVIAMRGSGKSCYSRLLLSRLKFVNDGIVRVMAGSSKVRGEWAQVVHKLYVAPPSIDGLDQFIKKQNSLVDKYEREGRDFPKELHTTLVLDDCAAHKAFMKSKQMEYLASNSRNLECTVIVIVQYIIQLTSEFRSQLNIVILLGNHNLRSKKYLHGEFASNIPYRTFEVVMHAMTRNRGVFIIDTRAHATDILTFDKSVWPPPENMRLGSDIMWNFSRNHFLNIDNIDPQFGPVASDALDDVIDEDDEMDEHGMNALRQLASNRVVFNDKKGQIIVMKQMRNPNLPKLKSE